MNLNIELPKDILFMTQADLKEVIREIISEFYGDKAKSEIMTIKETAEYLKVSVPTVRALIANKEMPFFQRGQVIRLKRSDVIEWMSNNS